MVLKGDLAPKGRWVRGVRHRLTPRLCYEKAPFSATGKHLFFHEVAMIVYDPENPIFDPELRVEIPVGELLGMIAKKPFDYILANYACGEDIVTLAQTFGGVMENDLVRIAEISQSSLRKEYRGKGYGSEMYLGYLRQQWDLAKKPFVCIPNKCGEDGQTSLEASRVWQSLGRKYPRVGDCIAILARP